MRLRVVLILQHSRGERYAFPVSIAVATESSPSTFSFGANFTTESLSTATDQFAQPAVAGDIFGDPGSTHAQIVGMATAPAALDREQAALVHGWAQNSLGVI